MLLLGWVNVWVGDIWQEVYDCVLPIGVELYPQIGILMLGWIFSFETPAIHSLFSFTEPNGNEVYTS